MCRPSFIEMSKFIESLLKEDAILSDESSATAGYYYTRNVTKNIPDDYHEQAMLEDDGYITVLPALQPNVG